MEENGENEGSEENKGVQKIKIYECEENEQSRQMQIKSDKNEEIEENKGREEIQELIPNFTSQKVKKNGHG